MISKKLAFVVASILLTSSHVNAGFLDNESTLLTAEGMNMLEAHMGEEKNWNQIWYSGTGALPAEWHATVDPYYETVSIMKAVNSVGREVLVGGYNSHSWAGKGESRLDDTFIFNLTDGEFQDYNGSGTSIYRNNSYFANFGSDLSGGIIKIGAPSPYYTANDGYTMPSNYGDGSNPIDLNDEEHSSDPRSHRLRDLFKIYAIETFAFSDKHESDWTYSSTNSKSTDATNVSEPTTLAIIGLGLAGLMARRRS